MEPKHEGGEEEEGDVEVDEDEEGEEDLTVMMIPYPPNNYITTIIMPTYETKDDSTSRWFRNRNENSRKSW